MEPSWQLLRLIGYSFRSFYILSDKKGFIYSAPQLILLRNWNIGIIFYPFIARFLIRTARGNKLVSRSQQDYDLAVGICEM